MQHPLPSYAHADPISELSWEDKPCFGLTLERSWTKALIRCFTCPRHCCHSSSTAPLQCRRRCPNTPLPTGLYQRLQTEGNPSPSHLRTILVDDSWALQPRAAAQWEARRTTWTSPRVCGDSWGAAWITKFQGTVGWGKQCSKWTCLKLPHGKWTLATHTSPEQSEKLVVCLNNWVCILLFKYTPCPLDIFLRNSDLHTEPHDSKHAAWALKNNISAPERKLEFTHAIRLG